MEKRKEALDNMKNIESFDNKIVIIGYGSVGTILLPLILKLIKIDLSNIIIIDKDINRFLNLPKEYRKKVQTFVYNLTEYNTEDILIDQLKLSKDDIIIECAYYICTNYLFILCEKYSISFVNTSVGTFYNHNLSPEDITYFSILKKLEESNKINKEKYNNFIIASGCNPGNVNIWTMYALEKINKNKIKFVSYAELAYKMGLEVVHISEKDSQITGNVRKNNEYVNTWALDAVSWYGEAFGNVELGWGTHEDELPENIIREFDDTIQLTLDICPITNWAHTYGPISKNIIGMLIPHEECVMICQKLSIEDTDNNIIYKPSCYFIYRPCDASLASTMEIFEKLENGYNNNIQPKARLMTSDIIDGGEELGCTLFFSNGDIYWIGSVLKIEEARYLLDNKYDNIVNATNLQVGAGCIGSLIYLIRSIKNKKFSGLLKPEDLPIKDFINLTKPLLGDFIFKKIDDWTYQKNNNIRKHKFSDFTIV
jgi:homospermidine synthase